MGCIGREDRYVAWNFSEMVVTCDPESRMDSHCMPSSDTVAAQRGLIRPTGKPELSCPEAQVPHLCYVSLSWDLSDHCYQLPVVPQQELLVV